MSDLITWTNQNEFSYISSISLCVTYNHTGTHSFICCFVIPILKVQRFTCKYGTIL